jgi:hypothetical protein
LRREEERRLLSLAHAVAGEAPVGCVPSRGSTRWFLYKCYFNINVIKMFLI